MKTSRPHILIVTTHTGGGHINLAQSLREVLSENYTVDIRDPYPDMLHDYYSLLSRHFLGFWDLQYALTDNEIGARLVHGVLTFFARKHITELLERCQPELVISTHPLLSYEIARASAAQPRKIPLVFQLTDLGQTHITWFTEKQAAAYLAPTREIHTQAKRHGIPAHRLHMTGRPIRRQFLQPDMPDRATILTSLNLDPTLFTVFLQGGAKGSAGIDRTVNNFLRAEIPIQIIMAIGNNTALAHRFANIERLRTLPFTETIAPYMAASDLIAGKAGASFLSEAFTLEKPCFITSYIPGQESQNLTFLEMHNLGWVCLDPDKQEPLINQIITQPALMAKKKMSIQTYKTWNMQANQNIHQVVENLLSTT